MSTGIYVAMSGARVQELALETVSNNLANALTPGFKTQHAVYRQAEADVRSMGDPRQAMGLHHPVRFLPEDRIRGVVEARFTHFEQGALRQTHNALDLALEGEGFFVVGGPGGPQYTRNGTFGLAPDGTLATRGGAPVLDVDGQPIRIGDGAANVGVTREGAVQLDGNEVARLAVVRFDDLRALERRGDSHWAPRDPEATPPQRLEAPSVHQGWLEQSNVNAVGTMSLLIRTNRVFELNTKAIQAYRQMDQSAAQEVGKVV